GVVDGHVAVAKGDEHLELGAGDAVLLPRQGPAQRIAIQPADAVRWIVYYPPASWTLPPSEEPTLDPGIVTAWHLRERGDLVGFAEVLDGIDRSKLNAPSLIRLAALLLAAGRADEAEAALGRAEAMGSKSALIPAYRTIIAVAENRTEAALALSERAMSAA